MVQIKDNKIKISIREITVWLYALYGIRAVWLAFSSMEYSPAFYLLNQIIGYLCIPAGAFLLATEGKYKVEGNNFKLLVIPVTYWIICVLNTYGGWKIGNGIVTLVQIVIFLFLDKNIKSAVFDRFYKIIQTCNVVSLFVWGCYQLNLPIGIQTVKFYYGGFAVYKKWIIFAIYHHNGSLTTLTDRLCGIFNEPGALGTICALMFIATFRHSKKWEKVLLLLTGLFTYSAAFFILIFGYLVIYLLQKDIRYVAIAIIIGAFFLKIPEIDFGNEALNRVAARMELTDSGFAGDNRLDESYKIGYEAMKKTSKIYWGYGKGFSFKGNSSSYVNYIVQFGYIGFGIMILQWIVASLHRVMNREQLIYVLFFFISLYQRPAPITSILGYILIFAGLAWMQQKEETDECFIEVQETI